MQLTMETARAAGLDTRPSVMPFFAPEFHAAEREHLFRRCWLMIGSVQEIPHDGDFITRSIDVLSLSALIVRGRDGVVRAFHNVCPHRGNAISERSRGNAKAFVCGMHSWTFATDGTLRGMPKHLTFCDVDKAEHGLKKLGLGIWNGLIFIHLDEDPDLSFEDFLGPLIERPGQQPFSGWQRYGRYSATSQANWKTFQAAFIESSHVTSVHPRSVGDYLSDPVAADFMTYGRHGRMTFYMNMHHEPYPVELSAIKRGGGFMTGAGDGRLSNVNDRDAENFAFDMFHIFPNTLLMFANTWSTLHQFWPIDENNSYWEASYFAAPSTRPSAMMAQNYFASKVRDTVREDLLSIEATQRGFRSGGISKLTLCAEELLIAHHLDGVMRYVQPAGEVAA